jgi:uncharacterized membrane protein
MFGDYKKALDIINGVILLYKGMPYISEEQRKSALESLVLVKQNIETADENEANALDQYDPVYNPGEPLSWDELDNGFNKN